MFSVYHDQKDGSDFSDVTLASEDDNDNSDLNTNSVPGPLDTPPTVMFTAHITISHITEKI